VGSQTPGGLFGAYFSAQNDQKSTEMQGYSISTSRNSMGLGKGREAASLEESVPRNNEKREINQRERRAKSDAMNKTTLSCNV
jgi:hypothetical protein